MMGGVRVNNEGASVGGEKEGSVKMEFMDFRVQDKQWVVCLEQIGWALRH